MKAFPIAVVAALLSAAAPAGVEAQTAAPAAQRPIDQERARQLYVSKDPADHSIGRNFARDIQQREAIEKRYAEASKGVMDFRKITYRSSVGDMDIPAYLFQPLKPRGPKGHAAMVWVHGGVHGNWGINYFPFVKEAVERGYVIIAPEYRGSTGYGEAHHNAIDYGGKEVLQMKHVAATTTAELRRGMLKNYLENLIDDNRIPENGAHLAAEAVGMLHGGQPLGLKLIRVTQHLRLEYDEISKIPSSGGEKVMAAMLLYFVIAKLRAENRARRADGGPLILDNPFAKMNMESLWRAVRSLADAMGVQCIFATILEDKNALSVFDRLIELRPGPVNKRTERRHVEAVDVTFRSPVPA